MKLCYHSNNLLCLIAVLIFFFFIIISLKGIFLNSAVFRMYRTRAHLFLMPEKNLLPFDGSCASVCCLSIIAIFLFHCRECLQLGRGTYMPIRPKRVCGSFAAC